MTTNEALDLLERLSSPELAARAEVEASRPFGRFPARYFKADIPSQELEITSRRPQNSNFDEWGIYLTVDVTEVYESSPPIEPGNYQLWIRSANPTTRDGKENKRTQNSELVQTTLAAGRSPKSWPGSKGVVFHEEVFDYKYDRNTNQKDSSGKDIWERGVDGRTFYYKMTFGGASPVSNGAAPVAAEPTQKAIDAALKLLGTDGMDEAAFQLAASKDPAIKNDGAFISALASGKWAADMIAAGKIVRDGSQLVVVAD